MDYAAIAYATVVAAGGVMGYVKKGSLVSGLMGLAFGGILGMFWVDKKLLLLLQLKRESLLYFLTCFNFQTLQNAKQDGIMFTKEIWY